MLLPVTHELKRPAAPTLPAPRVVTGGPDQQAKRLVAVAALVTLDDSQPVCREEGELSSAFSQLWASVSLSVETVDHLCVLAG